MFNLLDFPENWLNKKKKRKYNFKISFLFIKPEMYDNGLSSNKCTISTGS